MILTNKHKIYKNNGHIVARSTDSITFQVDKPFFPTPVDANTAASFVITFQSRVLILIDWGDGQLEPFDTVPVLNPTSGNTEYYFSMQNIGTNLPQNYPS